MPDRASTPSPDGAQRAFGLWTMHDGRSLHDATRESARRNRKRGPSPGMHFLPGTYFTDGAHLFEVVYGVQGLGPNPAGWVAAIRTDFEDGDDAPERYCYSLFSWIGRARDEVIVTGKSAILRLVKPAPRLVAHAS